MNLSVIRDKFTPQSTTSQVAIDGVFQCYGLEPRADKSHGKPYCIPAGTYQVLIEMSPRFGFETPHVQDVPGFTEIEIHLGNYPTDTEGCLVVGESRDVDFVGGSAVAFAALMAKLKTAENAITITYSDEPSGGDSWANDLDAAAAEQQAKEATGPQAT